MRTPETIATLNTLIRVCRDAEGLCRSWRATSGGGDLRNRLRLRSEEWGRQGDELQALVLLLGGEPETGGTALASIRRIWTACRASLPGHTDLRVAEDCERAQQLALGCYEHALEGYLPERIRRTVSLQARQISARCERLEARGGHFAAP